MQVPVALVPSRLELKQLLDLALPVVVVQVGLMLMGVVDSIMVGHVSAAALAGVALANVYFFGVSIFGVGMLMALDPVVSQAVGARDEESIARAVWRGLILALAVSIPSSILLLFTAPVLGALRQPAEIVPIAHEYTLRIIPSVVAFFAFGVFRQVLQAMGRLAPIVWATLIANLFNVFVNWILIFGKLGFEPMGANGSAWSTTMSRWLIMLLLLVLAWKELHGHLRRWHRSVLDLAPLGRMVAIGAPIGIHMQLEFGVFGGVGLLMGQFGTTAVAAHQIALNLASLTFMVPLGVGVAGSVLVGRAIGEGSMRRARRAARSALVVGVGFMVFTALLFTLVPGVLAGVYTTDPAVLSLAVLLLPLAGLFQVFDGLQVVSSGILRGMADTRFPMVMGLVGFWLVGLPISLFLGFRMDMGPTGLWWGLVVGLIVVGLLLLARARNRLRREVARVVVDAGTA